MKLHSGKRIVLGKNTQRCPRVSFAIQENSIKMRVSLTRRQSQLTTLGSWVLLDHPVGSGARQYLLWDGYNARVRNCWQSSFMYFILISCAKSDNENGFDEPVKL